jgi:hypothetical protein
MSWQQVRCGASTILSFVPRFEPVVPSDWIEFKHARLSARRAISCVAFSLPPDSIGANGVSAAVHPRPVTFRLVGGEGSAGYPCHTSA